MDHALSFDAQITSTSDISPATRNLDETTIPLSIIDCTVSYFSRCACVFFFDPPAEPEAPIAVSHLKKSLSATLDAYRQWCGRLSYTTPRKDGGHTTRYRRINVTFNMASPTGIPFVTAVSPRSLSDFIPASDERRTSSKAWDVSELPATELVPKTPLSLSRPATEDSPNVLVQYTSFSCGSSALGIAITHGLADAQSLATFVKDWAVTSRAMLDSPSLPELQPLFEPGLLDQQAAGDIDASVPDMAIVQKARDLPCLRQDWYLDTPGNPSTMRPSDWSSQDLTSLSPGVPIKWESWNFKAKLSHQILHFSSAKIQNLSQSASDRFPGQALSKLEILLAHLWQCIAGARQVEQDQMTLTLSLRSRLGLPARFLGSPIMLAAVPCPVTAPVIHDTLQKFTPDAIKAHLHDAAFEVSPHRLWQAMLGSKSMIVTTWLHLDLNQLDFGPGMGSVRFALPEMGGDGLIEIMETPGLVQGKWWEKGVDVMCVLEEQAMRRMLSDKDLFGGGSHLG
ncbi:transferase [Phlyctema vagabunda]|uniref:Transferase n=1 Tax=Phlyctema vagabunda TaxID=108571 RepID=A0ABR4PMW7_9HELO